MNEILLRDQLAAKYVAILEHELPMDLRRHNIQKGFRETSANFSRQQSAVSPQPSAVGFGLPGAGR